MDTKTSIDHHLEALRKVLVDDRQPFCSGTVKVDPKEISIYYKNHGKVGAIEFATATEDDLRHLVDTCDPAGFGKNDQNVYDESIRKAWKLDEDKFMTRFHPFSGLSGGIIEDAISIGFLNIEDISILGKEERAYKSTSPKHIRAELYKLNVYGEGGFFKPHKDTPRSVDMIGSLVITLPTQHEGGELVFHKNGKTWTFDPASVLAEEQMGPCVAYAAFYSDVDHEVLPVKSGYRVTLTYNLYCEVPCVRSTPRVETDMTIPSDGSVFRETLERALEDSAFLPEGGLLAFPLQHMYPFPKGKPNKHKYVRRHLKGMDALVFRTCKDLDLDVGVNMITYDDFLLEKDLTGESLECGLSYYELINCGGRELKNYHFDEKFKSSEGESVYIVGPKNNNMLEMEYYDGETSLGNEPALSTAYTALVLIAEIGPPEDRREYERPQE